jgi:hypothetical protein
MSDQILNAAVESLIGGTSGQIVVCQGAGAIVTTSALKTVGGTSLLGSGNIAVGSGDAVGPSSSTDNAIARFDATTGKLLQNSVVTIGDTGNITGLGTVGCGAITATAGMTIPAGDYFNQAITFSGSTVTVDASSSAFNIVAGGQVAFSAKQTQVSVRINGKYGITDSSSSLGTVDVNLCRNATGPKWSALAAGGLEVRNFAGSADAPITGSTITASSALNIAPITKTALLALTPTAATAGRWRVTDATPANREAYPDGTNWRYTSDDVVVT